jgi:hypothetical protein
VILEQVLESERDEFRFLPCEIFMCNSFRPKFSAKQIIAQRVRAIDFWIARVKNSHAPLVAAETYRRSHNYTR